MFDRRNIKYTYLKLSKKIKDFLLSDKSREFLIFLFFFLIAGGFWLLQTLNIDYEAEFSIPVRMKDLPNNVVALRPFSPYKYPPGKSLLPKPEQTSLLFQKSAEFVAGLYQIYSPKLYFEYMQFYSIQNSFRSINQYRVRLTNGVRLLFKWA